MSLRMKVYVLYPWAGGMSARTEHYSGVEIYTFARDIKQAYAVAFKKAWVDPMVDVPGAGILLTRSRTESEGRITCGCRGRLSVEHGDGIRKVQAALAEHKAEGCTGGRWVL